MKALLRLLRLVSITARSGLRWRCLQVASIALLCLLCISCDSEKPLSNPEDSKPDLRLVGVWQRQSEDGQTFYLQFTRLGANFPDSMLLGVMVSFDKQGKTKAAVMEERYCLAFPTVIRETSYLNFGPVSSQTYKQNTWQQIVRPFFIWKYQVSQSDLEIWGLDQNVKVETIRTGKLRGKGGFIQDSTENLYRFVSESGDRIFVKKLNRLEKVGLKDGRVDIPPTVSEALKKREETFFRDHPVPAGQEQNAKPS